MTTAQAIGILSVFLAGNITAGAASSLEVVTSKADLWGDAALRQPNGPSYEFFADLLPPPRYVNADFKYYPVALSAPRAKQKARWISNGSGLNVRGGTRSWHDTGTAVIFRVGPDELRFGEYRERIDGPRYLDGYLPIVQIAYTHGDAVYTQEAFASVDPQLAEHALVLVRFGLSSGTNGFVAVQFDSKAPVHVGNGAVRDDTGHVLGWFDGNWQWMRQRLVGRLNEKSAVTLAVPMQPMEATVSSPLKNGGYKREREKSIEAWNAQLAHGMRVELPEQIVTNAAGALIAQNFALINGDRMHYSAGNQYDRLYEAEGCDATQALLVWGYTNEVKKLIPALLSFTRKGLEYHQAGHKLQLLAHYFWLTRDAEFIRSQKSHWDRETRRIVESRTNAHGLFPREQYCGDVPTPVFSLNSNAKCWRALRDFSVVLAEVGEDETAKKLSEVAVEFRKNILAAVEKSVRKETQPPFVPIALLGEESGYDPITGTKIGSYWNLMANYVLGTELFGPGAEQEKWLLDYVREHGGLCMGLIRSRPNPTFWTGPHSINPLYGLRRALTLLRRDEVDQVLVSFYGMLAQGMTRDTFIGGEGCSLTPLDEGGRLFYCPPNSASNGYWLWILRCLLVQDWDMNDDGAPETLRLLYATPRRWLEDGGRIKVENALTSFGTVSVDVESKLAAGEVLATLKLPKSTLKGGQQTLRLRLPEPWRVVTATSGEEPLKVAEDGTIDLTGRDGELRIRAAVKK